jgi:hypothetical protein
MIVSGDRESEVRFLANSVGITEIYAEQTPEQKLEIVRKETKIGKTLYVGDGINDAPAMLAALAARHDGLLDARLGLLGLGGFALGVALFSGDLTMRTFLGYPLFAMAAPSGGVLLIGGWLVLAAAGLVKQK